MRKDVVRRGLRWGAHHGDQDGAQEGGGAGGRESGDRWQREEEGLGQGRIAEAKWVQRAKEMEVLDGVRGQMQPEASQKGRSSF